MTELASALDRVRDWLFRFVVVPDNGDLDTLALWVAHTWCLDQTATTPRLLVDSSMPGSGKTTLLEHVNALSMKPLLAASLSSPALLTRMLAAGPRTVLIDEVDRNLDPKREGTGDLLSVINAGYKRGATRPVLVPGPGGSWEPKELPTYAPVAMAGNAPLLPDDTRSRCIRVLLMPDFRGEAEDTDWEEIDAEATALRDALAECVDQAREQISVKPGLPAGCRGRMAEKWRPLARVAHAAGGAWVEAVNAAIARDMDEVEADLADGMTQERPAVVLLRHLAEVWPAGESFVPTSRLVELLIFHHPEAWSEASTYGKDLTTQRLGRLLSQGFKIHTSRRADNGGKARGYASAVLSHAWGQFNLDPPWVTGPTGRTGQTPETMRNASPEPVQAPTAAEGASPESHGMDRFENPVPRHSGEQAGSTGWTGSAGKGPVMTGKCSHGFEPSTCIRCEAERRGVA